MKNNILFEKTDVWINYDQSNIIKSIKLPLILELIPKGTKTILDVGCGNGILTNELAQHYNTTGCDRSVKALEYVKTKKFQADIRSLPFENKSFDLVLCSEVLEHLPIPIFKKAVEELDRVASTYLLITVPYQEYLPQNFIKCPKCKSIFHSYGHVQSFTEESIYMPFKEKWNMLNIFAAGPQHRHFNKTLLFIKHNLGRKYFYPSEAISQCENCGNKSFAKPKGNLVSKACNLINRYIGKNKPYWIFMLLQHKHG